MLNNRYRITLGGKSYSPKFQTDPQYAAAWKRVLERAYGREHGLCGCPGSGERKVTIKLREGSDGYHLARYPHSGPEHANDCRFYAAAPERSGLQGYAVGVVEETADGGMKVRLARGVRQQAPEEAGDAAPSPPAAPGVKKPAMTLLSLLHLLWSESRLTTWYPAMAGKRNGELISHLLHECAGRVSVAPRIKLDQVLLLAAQKEKRRESTNREIATNAASRNWRLVVVSPLARYDEERHSGSPERLPVTGPFGMPTLYLPPAVWETASRRFGQELGAWRRGSRVIAIAQVTQRPGKAHQADVLEVALMQVSEQWIPLDSNLEGKAEQKLRDEGRKFDKPLRYDADECAVFPDFWLLDMQQDFALEVFGMATPQYLERRGTKEQWYCSEYGKTGWWRWDATQDPRGEHIPAFPAAYGSSR